MALAVYKLEWQPGKIINAAMAAVEVSSEEGAKLVEKDMRRFAPVDTGEMRDAIEARASKFKNGGWIVGVFEQSPPGKWEDSLGARAVFNEYGHAAPYKGRTEKGTKLGGAKIVPPRSFIRKALNRNKRRINKIYQEQLGE